LAEAESAALALAGQAQAAAAQKDYERADALFAEAAATRGLGQALRWTYRNDRPMLRNWAAQNNAALNRPSTSTKDGPPWPPEERPDDWQPRHNLRALDFSTAPRAPLLLNAPRVFENALAVRT
jgi:hypothetical protein